MKELWDRTFVRNFKGTFGGKFKGTVKYNDWSNPTPLRHTMCFLPSGSRGASGALRGRSGAIKGHMK